MTDRVQFVFANGDTYSCWPEEVDRLAASWAQAIEQIDLFDQYLCGLLGPGSFYTAAALTPVRVEPSSEP